jgi:hypothetical protein
MIYINEPHPTFVLILKSKLCDISLHTNDILIANIVQNVEWEVNGNIMLIWRKSRLNSLPMGITFMKKGILPIINIGIFFIGVLVGLEHMKILV